MTHTYLIALGSNMCKPAIGNPRKVIRHAASLLDEGDLSIKALSSIIETAPLGPSQRKFANAAALIDSPFWPEEMLDHLQTIEKKLGRRKQGQIWRARVIDLDIIQWSGGIWASESLQIPHSEMRNRDFVLGPASQISGKWRDPISSLSLQQLFARLTRPVAATRGAHSQRRNRWC